jgi:RimJ/RimL family protein N-acetyltransferase
MRRSVAGYQIDDDPARIDPAAAVSFLTTGAYWGRWRGERDIRRQVAAAWRVTGAYDAAGAMVGFARAFSDGGSAYLSDVYVLPEHRGAGLGKAIVAMMVEEGPGAGQRWMLHTSVPFAVIRAADGAAGGAAHGAVIGSTRFRDLGFWPRPGRAPKTTADTCEIGHTWLAPAAVRTGANTEMKRLMLTHAFEVWQVSSVCVHTDARNQRSRDAMQRIGARFEGVLHAHRPGVEGKPRDSARFSITAAEWPSVRRHLDELSRRRSRRHPA